MVKRLSEILELAKGCKRKTLSVAVAGDKEVLHSVTEAVRLGIINAILVGDAEKIRSIAQREALDIQGIEILDEKVISRAVEKAVELVAAGIADYIMKGMISTAELLKAVLNKDKGLRANGLLSHVMLYEAETYPKLLMLTDGGMVPFPGINEKVEIIKNAVRVAHAIKIDCPKIAPLCAVELVNPNMQATVDASILSLMNKRNQISGCIIEGPLALDNAVSKEAAEHKGIISEVAGDSDILLVPNIECGNLLGKSLTYFAKAENAGVIVGAKCPIVLVSRADSSKAKLFSIALGAIID